MYYINKGSYWKYISSYFKTKATFFCVMQWLVLLPVVLTLIATNNNDSKVVDAIADLCYPKWALEAFVIANAKRFGLTILLSM